MIKGRSVRNEGQEIRWLRKYCEASAALDSLQIWCVGVCGCALLAGSPHTEALCVDLHGARFASPIIDF